MDLLNLHTGNIKSTFSFDEFALHDRFLVVQTWPDHSSLNATNHKPIEYVL